MESLKSLIMVTLLTRGECALVSLMGQALLRITGVNLTGLDWIALGPSQKQAERLHRVNAVGGSAILRKTHEVLLDAQMAQCFQTISVPLGPNADGQVTLDHFVDWLLPEHTAIVLRGIRSDVPDGAEIIRLIADEAALTTAQNMRQQEERLTIIFRAAIGGSYGMRYSCRWRYCGLVVF